MPPPQQPTILPYAEVRERIERRVNRDFDSSVADGRTDLHSRWRVGAKFPVGREWRGEVQYQYAHTLSWTPARNFSTWNSDASLAYVETARDGATITLGRQKIAVGSQRLIGPLEWVNVPRSFDGVRVRGRNLDAWAAKIGVGVPKPRDARLAGVSYGSRAGLSSLIYKHDDTPAGDVDVTTLNHWYNRTSGPLNIDAEAALQGGRTAGKDHSAWAAHLRVSYANSPRTKLFLEGNVASGGGDEDTVNTFDNLYPSNHDKYGIMDLVGWRNMTELAVGIEHQIPGGTARLAFRSFGLQDEEDAWYAAGGAPVQAGGKPMRDPTGDSGRELGQEIDLEATWSPNAKDTWSAGVAAFLPGRFVRNVAGTDDRQTWGYVQFTRRF